LGDKLNNQIILNKTVSFNATILNLVIFFKSSEFFCYLVIFAGKPVAALHPANVSHTAVRAVYPHVHTLKESMLTISCTTASVECCLSRYSVIIYTIAKLLWRRTMQLQLLC